MQDIAPASVGKCADQEYLQHFANSLLVLALRQVIYYGLQDGGAVSFRHKPNA